MVLAGNLVPAVTTLVSPELGFGRNLGYRLHPGTISLLFADLSSTTHAKDYVPRQFSWTSIHNQKTKLFLRALFTFSILV